MVLIGWIINSPVLIQIFTDYVPMQFNTAIGFILAGAGLYFVNFSKVYKANVAGLAILFISCLTLFEYTFDVDLGIDQLFFQHYITVETSHPGRMAPNTAICFILVSLTLFLTTRGKYFNRTVLFSGISGGIISALSIVAVIGYLVDLESAYGWGQFTRMAFHTAMGFVILGVGIIAFSWKNEPVKIIGSPNWLPALVCVGDIILTVFLSQAFESTDQHSLSTIVLNSGILSAIFWPLLIYFYQRYRDLFQKIENYDNYLAAEISKREQALEREAQSIKNQEKASLARDIHDELGQFLTIIKLGLIRFNDGMSKENDSNNSQIKSLIKVVDKTIKSVQRIATNLRPQSLDTLELYDVLLLHSKEFQKQTGVKCEIFCSSERIQINKILASDIFRVYQEALTNVARHAKASIIKVTFTHDKNFLILKVRDNGKGIKSHNIRSSKSIGLEGIYERVNKWGGELNIIGAPGEGTSVEVKIPF